MTAPVEIGLSLKINTDASSPRSSDGGREDFGGRISERNSEEGSEAEIIGLPTKNLVVQVGGAIGDYEINTQQLGSDFQLGSGFKSKTLVEGTQSPRSQVEEIDHLKVNQICDDRAVGRRS
jgi:hypothetical protein